MAKPKYATREEWLLAASEKLRSKFDAAFKALDSGYKMPPLSHLQIGVMPLGKKKLGLCWSCEHAEDKKTSPIGICASLKDPVPVLATLVHELIHAAIGHEHKHNATFKKHALSLGLTGRMTATSAGEELAKELEKLGKELGAYPHVAYPKILVQSIPKPKKVKNVTFASETEGMEEYRCSVKRVNWKAFGPPRDPAGNEMKPTRAEE